MQDNGKFSSRCAAKMQNGHCAVLPYINDNEIILPIVCHTTLKPSASKYEMSLFIADKLAWDQDGVPPFYNSVESALDNSLEKACFMYMKYMNENGKVMFPHTDWTAAYNWLKSVV